MPKRDCKVATQLIDDHLESVEYEGKEYYYIPVDTKIKESGLKLLGGFDEYFLGYKDRSLVANLDYKRDYFSINGIFFPLILVDGEIIGRWKRTFKKDSLLIEYSHIDQSKSIDIQTLILEAKRYAAFWGVQEVRVEEME